MYNRVLSSDEVKGLYSQKIEAGNSYVSQRDIQVDEDGNLTLTGKITFAFGVVLESIETNVLNLIGSLRMTGTLSFDNNIGGIIEFADDYGSYFAKIQAKRDDGLQIAVRGVDNYGNHNLILISGEHLGADFDHEEPSTDPTFFIHSVTHPNDDNTEWIGFSYSNATDEGMIQTGKGDIYLNSSTGNITMRSPDGTKYSCGVADGGAFTCS